MKDIDVSECCYLINYDPPKGQGNWCSAIHKGACKVYSKDCEYNENCYYKQLKRLEQENKQLKEEIEEYMKSGGQMKLTYQLGTINFNIKFLKCVSEIRTTNDYETQEVEKRINKEMDESTLKCTIGESSNVHIYADYEKDCKTLEIYIDEKLYKCSNYELVKSGSNPYLFSSPKYRITTETQKKFDIFQAQAENLLKAFKELQEDNQ